MSCRLQPQHYDSAKGILCKKHRFLKWTCIYNKHVKQEITRPYVSTSCMKSLIYFYTKFQREVV